MSIFFLIHRVTTDKKKKKINGTRFNKKETKGIKKKSHKKIVIFVLKEKKKIVLF